MSKLDGGTFTSILCYKSHVHIHSSFRIVFVPTSFISLPPGVMLRMHLRKVANITDFSIEVRNSENDPYFSRFLSEF